LSLAERSSNAAELIAPQDEITISADNSSRPPFLRMTTFEILRPELSVSSFST
jgi:hypothetical protein